jgi:hypothetical protein
MEDQGGEAKEKEWEDNTFRQSDGVNCMDLVAMCLQACMRMRMKIA